MKKISIILLVFLFFGLASLLIYSRNTSFKHLSPAAMYKRIITERDYAIKQAVARGDYRCCITPPCTMCYLEPNQWNNFQAGTCACDDLIAQGKEPCPQCKKSVCGKSNNESDSFCSLEQS